MTDRAGSPELPESQAVEGWRNGPVAWFQYFLVRITVRLFALLPEPILQGVLTVLARIARRVDRRHADPAREFLDAALGPDLDPARREAFVLGAFRHLARVAIDTIRRPARVAVLRDHFTIEACPEMEPFLAEPSSMVFVTAHVGDWEASTQILASIGFRPLYVVAKPPKNRPLSRWMQRRRQQEGVHLLSRYGAVDGARRAVAGGGSIGFLLDHRATKKPVLAPFFGRPALCERTSGVLLRRLRRPVAIIACYRTEVPLHYRVVFPRVFAPEELARQSPEQIATEINAELEQRILAAPEQYHWLHDRYRGVERFQRKQARLRADAAEGSA